MRVQTEMPQGRKPVRVQCALRWMRIGCEAPLVGFWKNQDSDAKDNQVDEVRGPTFGGKVFFSWHFNCHLTPSLLTSIKLTR